ncbi:MAG TPA: maltotransferase domain-containing protein, partial [Actinomycetota bacterium]
MIEHVSPSVDGGRFPAKATVGDVVPVEADVFADGHDHVAARMLHRHEGDRGWSVVAMRALGNDR